MLKRGGGGGGGKGGLGSSGPGPARPQGVWKPRSVGGRGGGPAT